MMVIDFFKRIQVGWSFEPHSWVIGVTLFPKTIIFSFLCFDFGIKLNTYPICGEFMVLSKEAKLYGHTVYNDAGKPEYFSVDSVDYGGIVEYNDTND